jgi:hypothetical protein
MEDLVRPLVPEQLLRISSLVKLAQLALALARVVENKLSVPIEIPFRF